MSLSDLNPGLTPYVATTNIETALDHPDTPANGQTIFRTFLEATPTEATVIATKLVTDEKADEFLGEFYRQGPSFDHRSEVFSALVEKVPDAHILGQFASALDEVPGLSSADRSEFMDAVLQTGNEELIAGVRAERLGANFGKWGVGETTKALSVTVDGKTPEQKIAGTMANISKASDESLNTLFGEWAKQPVEQLKAAHDGIGKADISDDAKKHLNTLLGDAIAGNDKTKSEAYEKAIAAPPPPPVILYSTNRLHVNSGGQSASFDLGFNAPFKSETGVLTLQGFIRKEERMNEAGVKPGATTVTPGAITANPDGTFSQAADVKTTAPGTPVAAITEHRTEVDIGVAWKPAVTAPGVEALISGYVVLQDSRQQGRQSIQTLMENVTASGSGTTDSKFGIHGSGTYLHFDQIGAPGTNNSQNMFFAQGGPHQTIGDPKNGFSLRLDGNLGVSGVQTNRDQMGARVYVQAAAAANYTWPGGSQIGLDAIGTHALSGPASATNMFDWLPAMSGDSLTTMLRAKLAL